MLWKLCVPPRPPELHGLTSLQILSACMSAERHVNDAVSSSSEAKACRDQRALHGCGQPPSLCPHSASFGHACNMCIWEPSAGRPRLGSSGWHVVGLARLRGLAAAFGHRGVLTSPAGGFGGPPGFDANLGLRHGRRTLLASSSSLWVGA